jgi:hemerythrin-like domain-containing protein
MNTKLIMNTATENLENDHIHILRLIDVMEHITQLDNPDISHIEDIVEIIKNFSDGIHHAKEEGFFFPLLAQKGFSLTQGPVAVMLNEHVAGRSFVRGISENIALYKKGDKSSLKGIFSNMSGYAQLLKSHISKENNILFRMADNALSESDQKDLLVKFNEAEKTSPASAEYINRIQNLTSFYGI